MFVTCGFDKLAGNKYSSSRKLYAMEITDQRSQEIKKAILTLLAKNIPDYISEDFSETFSRTFFVEIMKRSTEKRYAPLRVTEETIAYEFARIANELGISEGEIVAFVKSNYNSDCSGKICNYVCIFTPYAGEFFEF
jgi:hypothetical protein